MDSRSQRLVALAMLIVTAAALQIPLWGWEVEDAGIDVAYARSFADGFGLVPQVGAERVEGFSNPLWVLLLAAGSALGIDGFVLTRWLGLALGCAAIPAVYAAMRPIAKKLPYSPIIASTVLALYAPHAIWAQSGLENALFTLLLALGCARIAVDDDLEVLGPLAFLGVALTRPEGVMYGVVGAGAAVASAWTWPAALRRAALWVALFAAPLALFEFVRVAYFAQALPATFHAKLGTPEHDPFDPASRGWRQLMAFGWETGTLLAVPLAAVGASGAKGWWWLSAPISAALIGLAAATGSPWPLAVIVVGLPAVAIGRSAPILVAAALLGVGCAFHVGAGGDWMVGYRWMSLVGVPLAMLVGAGVVEVSERSEILRIPILVAAALAAVPQGLFVARFARDPEVTPQSVAERLDHWRRVARRLHLDRRLIIADHDMGGMLTWGAEHARIRDTRGLVDLPFALFGPDPAVVRHELFGEHPIDMAHVHGRTRSALWSLPEFQREFVEIEGYGRGNHRGQYLRRSLFLDAEGWQGTVLPISFAGGVSIRGIEVPSPEVGPGAALYVELGIDRGAREEPFRMVAFVTDGTRALASWELPPAYDWVPPAEWRPGEQFRGRFSLALPDDVPLGPVDLGIVLFDASGRVLPARTTTAPAYLPGAPVLAVGEVRIAGLATIVTREEMGRLALADKSDALAAAADGECEAAEHAWTLALRHRTRSQDWRASNRRPVAQAIARCYAARAGDRATDGEAMFERVREVERARDWDPRSPLSWSVGASLGAVAHGRAEAAEDVVERFRWAEAAVRADPRRSWDRRLAEEARAQQLKRALPVRPTEPDREAER